MSHLYSWVNGHQQPDHPLRSASRGAIWATAVDVLSVVRRDCVAGSDRRHADGGDEMKPIYYQDILKIMDEMEAEDEKEV